ncbi:MAG: asparagine synthase-related protein [Vicinamibacterales bacterium]
MPRPRAEQELAQMVESMHHEPFYVTGTWIDESLGVYVGWTARKSSFADGMPLFNETRDAVLVFSGEDYPPPGTAQRLNERGHSLPLDGPAYLVHLYEEDPTFPAMLNGTFHGLAIDKLRGTAMLFTDRYALHRLYYYQSADAFYFAGEAKAILSVNPNCRRLENRALGEFLGCGCVMEDRTLFDGVRVMPPAVAWTFSGYRLENKRTYFTPREWEQEAPLPPDEYYRALRDALSRNLPRYFNGRERIGISLTGGLDTRVIMAWLPAAPGSLPCYTFGSMFRDNQDVRVARRVSRSCEQPHSVIPVGRDFLSRFADYAERSVYLSDGCVDLSRTSDLYVSERARDIAPTKIVGTYGSEVLTGVTMMKPRPLFRGLLAAGALPYVQEAGVTYDGLRHEHPVTFAAFRQSPWWHYGVLALEETQLTVRSPFLDNEFIRTAYRAPQTPAATDVRTRLIAEGRFTLDRIPTDLGVGGTAGPFTSLVSRTFQKFTFRAEYAYDYGMPHWLARLDRVCSPLHLERLFLGRHKLAHYRIWYREALSEYVRSMLLDSRSLTRPYLEADGVRAIVTGHLAGHGNYTRELHKVLSLELVHRLFLDQR